MATELTDITEASMAGDSPEVGLTATELGLVQYCSTEPRTGIEESSVAASIGHGLLHRQPDQGDIEPPVIATDVPTSLAVRLYVSHFLSTWNSRVFEFGAALFLASIFPGTLLPVSIYSLVRNAGYILFAQPVGTWIERGNRLSVIQTSIVGQRVSVAASCGLFLVLLFDQGVLGPRKGHGIFALIVFLAVIEKLCSTMNMISVVVITGGNEAARRAMNARMRRIDLVCKLLGPLVVSLVAIASIGVAIWTTLGMNICSVIVEYVAIEQVYKRVSGLQRNAEATPASNDADMNEENHATGHARRRHVGPKTAFEAVIYNILPLKSLPFYFKHPAFLASFSLSLLYFTVLSFSGQMITYLLAVGYTSQFVGVARVVASIFEISATWIVPYLTRKIGVVRAGIWSLTWQMACLTGALGWYFSGYGGMGKGTITSATGLAVGVALSRIGLWGFDLCAQNIIQDARN
ncbi:hypothetical protein VSDG_09994 [Cytospora chrysosperma]|uniref:Solute carrier family 40 member n=1 Tax=Cytospora chrysosperma TaxID=252740 RepID=A0A423V8I0_CYTCH|nr:hypothetical protein VSDG_09994 [Valsa sordida]